ncbi:unnamed protein product [Closterium sp. Naga37s-1]|nr:unnamed protein product [Closterium sp. Naga37s-1]
MAAAVRQARASGERTHVHIAVTNGPPLASDPGLAAPLRAPTLRDYQPAREARAPFRTARQAPGFHTQQISFGRGLGRPAAFPREDPIAPPPTRAGRDPMLTMCRMLNLAEACEGVASLQMAVCGAMRNSPGSYAPGSRGSCASWAESLVQPLEPVSEAPAGVAPLARTFPRHVADLVAAASFGTPVETLHSSAQLLLAVSACMRSMLEMEGAEPYTILLTSLSFDSPWDRCMINRHDNNHTSVPPFDAFPALHSLSLLLPVPPLDALPRCSSLTSLTLWKPHPSTISSLASPSSSVRTSLKTVNLESAQLTACLAPLASFPSLSFLDLRSCSIDPCEMHTLSRSIHTLSELGIMNSPLISSHSLAALAHSNPALSSLSLHTTTYHLFSAQGLWSLFHAPPPHLHTLSFSGLASFRPGMLARCSGLHSLMITGRWEIASGLSVRDSVVYREFGEYAGGGGAEGRRRRGSGSGMCRGGWRGWGGG